MKKLILVALPTILFSGIAFSQGSENIEGLYEPHRRIEPPIGIDPPKRPPIKPEPPRRIDPIEPEPPVGINPPIGIDPPKRPPIKPEPPIRIKPPRRPNPIERPQEPIIRPY